MDSGYYVEDDLWKYPHYSLDEERNKEYIGLSNKEGLVSQESRVSTPAEWLASCSRPSFYHGH